MNARQVKDFSIKYEQSEIKYVTQFLVSPSDEEVLLDFSSGLLVEGEDQKSLPIQTRLAMPWSSVERLSAILNQVVAARGKQPGNSSMREESQASPIVPQATLPEMTMPHDVSG